MTCDHRPQEFSSNFSAAPARIPTLSKLGRGDLELLFELSHPAPHCPKYCPPGPSANRATDRQDTRHTTSSTLKHCVWRRQEDEASAVKPPRVDQGTICFLRSVQSDALYQLRAGMTCGHRQQAFRYWLNFVNQVRAGNGISSLFLEPISGPLWHRLIRPLRVCLYVNPLR